MDHQAGRLAPPPPWLKVVTAAKWYRAAPWDLLEQDDWEFWTEAGNFMQQLESEARKKGGNG